MFSNSSTPPGVSQRDTRLVVKTLGQEESQTGHSGLQTLNSHEKNVGNDTKREKVVLRQIWKDALEYIQYILQCFNMEN